MKLGKIIARLLPLAALGLTVAAYSITDPCGGGGTYMGVIHADTCEPVTPWCLSLLYYNHNQSYDCACPYFCCPSGGYGVNPADCTGKTTDGCCSGPNTIIYNAVACPAVAAPPTGF